MRVVVRVRVRDREEGDDWQEEIFRLYVFVKNEHSGNRGYCERTSCLPSLIIKTDRGVVPFCHSHFEFRLNQLNQKNKFKDAGKEHQVGLLQRPRPS